MTGRDPRCPDSCVKASVRRLALTGVSGCLPRGLVQCDLSVCKTGQGEGRTRSLPGCPVPLASHPPRLEEWVGPHPLPIPRWGLGVTPRRQGWGRLGSLVAASSGTSLCLGKEALAPPPGAPLDRWPSVHADGRGPVTRTFCAPPPELPQAVGRWSKKELHANLPSGGMTRLVTGTTLWQPGSGHGPCSHESPHIPAAPGPLTDRSSWRAGSPSPELDTYRKGLQPHAKKILSLKLHVSFSPEFHSSLLY